MVNPLICGSGTFNHQISEEEDDHDPCSPTTSSPRKPRKTWRSKDDSKNPYARFGRDKFSALVAELDDKRREIYSQMGSEEISFIRFAFSNTDNFKPIVVRARDKKRERNIVGHDSEGMDKFGIESSASPKGVDQPRKESGDKKTKKKMKSEKWWPFYCMLAVMILILLFLAVFGRSFAILCMSIGWYLVPAIKRGSLRDERQRKKNE